MEYLQSLFIKKLSLIKLGQGPQLINFRENLNFPNGKVSFQIWVDTGRMKV